MLTYIYYMILYAGSPKTKIWPLMVGNPPHGSAEGPATLFGPLEFQSVCTVVFLCIHRLGNLKIPYVVDGFFEIRLYNHLRLSNVYPGDFTWVWYIPNGEFPGFPPWATSHYFQPLREGHGGLHGCGGADPVLVQHTVVAWGYYNPSSPN